MIDTSCVMAVALRENDHETYETLLTKATHLHLSAVSCVELGIVAQNRDVSTEVEALLKTLKVALVSSSVVALSGAMSITGETVIATKLLTSGAALSDVKIFSVVEPL